MSFTTISASDTDSGERLVVEAMDTHRQPRRSGRDGAAGPATITELARLMNLNFDTRRTIYNLNPKHIRMIELARSLGASAKFAGSGGSIIGAYRDEEMFARLKAGLRGGEVRGHQTDGSAGPLRAE
jgi:glucuronokinase